MIQYKQKCYHSNSLFCVFFLLISVFSSLSQLSESLHLPLEYENGSHFSLILREKYSSQEEPSGFPGGSVVKNPPANAGNTGSSPDLGSSHMPRSN